MIRCPSCTTENSDTSKFCSECAAALRPEYAPTVTPDAHSEETSDPSNQSDSSHHGRFLPGTKIADRYRIVSLVGRGGMGEVYRADDLKLGHTVALKFLPRHFGDDPARLDYFLNEVRLTRQISHPNVCRVYDIGEVSEQHFLSMEYIDGEDLRVLLRRIGRLPKDKGVQIAKQLCAGLGAAHECGVLHRDLKPANVMLDGRGQIRITDFGLARLVEGSSREGIVGTPAYMAPEQFQDGTTTIQSDLYSLGLILYELFTGQPVHKSKSLQELIRTHQQESVAAPSSLQDDIDPAVERVILRCLEHEAYQRPKSAHAVAAALPGGDPLSAALAAGETPSPEMVAAAGKTHGLSLKAGVLHLTLVCALIVALPFCASWLRTNPLDVLRENAPAVLDNSARQWVKRMGYPTAAKGNTHVFADIDDFQYRLSSRPLRPRIDRLFGGGIRWKITEDNPSVLEPGMISIRLDPTQPFDSGRQLLEFLATPEADKPGTTSESASGEEYWEKYFQAVQIDSAGFRPVDGTERLSSWRPPIYADRVSVWQSKDRAETQIVMAVRDDKIVYFRRSNAPEEMSGFIASDNGGGGAGLVTIIAVVFSGLLALRNLRMRRADTAGGLRFALYYLAVECMLGIVTIQHMADFRTESHLVANYLLYAMVRTLRVWLYYVGVEPYVRRLWPDVLIVWSRVLSGRFRDPLFGRDLLVGCIFGVAFALVAQVVADVPGSLNTTLGGASVVNTTLFSHQLGLLLSLFDLSLLLLCRFLTRHNVKAVALFAAAMTLNEMFKFGFDVGFLNMWIAKAIWTICVSILYIRFGLMAAVIGTCIHWLLVVVPHTVDFGTWYAVASSFTLATVLVIACYGFFTSTLARHSLFQTLETETT